MWCMCMDSMDVVRGVYHMGTRVCAQQKQIELSTSRANWKKSRKSRPERGSNPRPIDPKHNIHPLAYGEITHTLSLSQSYVSGTHTFTQKHTQNTHHHSPHPTIHFVSLWGALLLLSEPKSNICFSRTEIKNEWFSALLGCGYMFSTMSDTVVRSYTGIHAPVYSNQTPLVWVVPGHSDPPADTHTGLELHKVVS